MVRTELPEPPVIGLMLKVRVKPAMVLLLRDTLPPKPFSAATEILEAPELPWTIAKLVGLELMLKSATPVTVTLMLTEWDCEPLVPVTITIKFPAVTVDATAMVVTDVPDPVMLCGLRLIAKPVGPVADRVTTLLKPLMADTVRVEVPEPPAGTVRVFGFAESPKSLSLTMTVAVTIWDNDPLEPLTVMV